MIRRASRSLFSAQAGIALNLAKHARRFALSFARTLTV